MAESWKSLTPAEQREWSNDPTKINGMCGSCGLQGVVAPRSFRAPKRGDKGAWALAERLLKNDGFPEFERARRGTLAYYWKSRRGGLGCFEHTYEVTWRQVWYPRHVRELPEWIRFMMNTPVKPKASPAYTKAERKAQAASWRNEFWDIL